MKEIKYSLDHDVNTYTIEISNQILDGSGIIYHPTFKALSYLLLDVIRRRVHKRKGHILVLTSSEIAAKHHTQFLERHLLTDSIGCPKNTEFDDVWPSVIVTSILSIPSLLTNDQNKNINLVIILDCHNAINNGCVSELILFTKKLEGGLAPNILCFTSCIFPDTLGQETVIEYLQRLETFYGCKLVTVCDEIALKRVFDAPDTTFNTFGKQDALSKSCMDALFEINAAKDLCANLYFHVNEKAVQTFASSSETFVSNTLSEIQFQLEELGECGGDLAALAAFRHLVRLYTFADSSPGPSTKCALGHLVCTLAKFRKILNEDMFRVQLCERIEYFSSKKVQLALNHLQVLPPNHKAILIVQNPNTASILTLMLQKIALQGKKHVHIKPELVVNCSSIPFSESWEDILWWERNMQVYSRFNAGETNTIVLSGDMQEMDLPCCDLILVLDKIENFSRFLSVKNQLKSETGKLILLCEKTELIAYEEKITKLQENVIKMQTLILSESCNTNQLVNTSLFKTPTGLEVKSDIATFLLYRYCDNLPHDKFSSPWPVWEYEKDASISHMIYATLYLSCSSPIKTVKSEHVNTWKMAQNSSSFQAICELYKAKELDDAQLISWQNKDERSEETLKIGNSSNLDVQAYFESQLGLSYLRTHCIEQKHLEDEDILCDTIYPRCLMDNYPKVNGQTFIYKIKIWPVSEPPPFGDNRKTVLYELLNDRRTFAILSSKDLLQVCPFPIFIFGHELCVEFETLSSIELDQSELMLLRRFHCGMFMKVLPIVQPFMQFDVYGSHNNYLVAPITAEGVIDWKVVQNNFSVPECREFSHEEKAGLSCTPELYERTMVKPCYRYLNSDQIYLVTSVCMDMCGDSCFPTEDFDTFTDYYKEKYYINLERPELPLLEAYLINTKVNGLLPRARSHKLRREEKMEDFREHMLPELCTPLLFPAALWLKLSCLPSVLHRFSRLLLIEEFRRTIIEEAGTGAPEIKFTPLQIDPTTVKDVSNVSKVPPSTVKRGLAIGNVKLENRKKRSESKRPWSGNQEPVDMYRNMQALNFVEIRYFDEYLVKSMANPTLSEVAEPPNDVIDCESDTDSCSSNNIESSPPIAAKKVVVPESLLYLKPHHYESCGPEQPELLEVFSSSSSNDGVNMDRIQVLGNAFLRLVITVYSYEYGLDIIGSATLTCLHRLRSDFMCKMNLEKFSVLNQLCNRVKVVDFTPGEWIPPSFTTPPMLKQVLKEQEISPDVLQQIELSEDEQLDGLIDADTEDKILETLTNFINRNTSRRDEMYVDRHIVPQSTAANCVEALIGTYFKSCGWQGGLKIISWLKLLPPIVNILDQIDRPPATFETGKLPISFNSLEEKLDYVFTRKTLLVQAVTHESFINPVIQGNMDTLAFLGISILDFLMTCYIYEHFSELNPPQLWRLREILCSTSSLAYLAVRHNIHKYILSNSVPLLDVIDRFIKHQKGCQQPIDDELQLLIEEHECESGFQVEVPNTLGKLLPALVGAVYIDSGKNIHLVWDTFKHIFLPELGLWRQDVPLSVVDLLKDLSPAAHQVIFTEKTRVDGEIEVLCKVLMDNTREKVFVAKGTDLNKTKTHAAKLALRNLLERTNLNY